MLDIGPNTASVLGALLTGGFALAGVFILTRSNRKQAQSERTWNARKLGYTSVLAKLKEASEAADIIFPPNDADFPPSGHDGVRRRPTARMADRAVQIELM